MKSTHQLADEIVYSRRKSLQISVLPGGKVVVRAPLRTSQAQIAAFLEDKAGWIDRARRKMHSEAPQTAYRFAEGEPIWYLGRAYPLHLVEKAPGGLVFTPEKGFLLQRNRKAQGAKLLRKFYREQARKLVQGYIDRYAPREGFTLAGVRITSAKTRWGSCSGRGSLNFSYRLALTPAACVEYVVVHELVHTRVHNHSAQFWAEVGRILPGYQQARKWLRENARKLPEIGA